MSKFKIYFTRPKKPKLSSKAIMWKLGTKYSHVAVEAYISSLDEYIVYESSYGSVHSIGRELFLERNHVVKCIEIELDSIVNIQARKFLIQNLGKEYGYLTIIGILFPWMKIGVDGNESFICSELIANILRMQYNIDMGKAIDYITPEDIENIVERLRD